MATFVEEFKDYKLLELSAKRHISLASELGRIVKQHGLTTISALEQSLACSNDHANQLKELMRLIEDPNVLFLPSPHSQTSKEDAIRLAVLYALHYEQKPGSKAPRPRHQRRHAQPRQPLPPVPRFPFFSHA